MKLHRMAFDRLRLNGEVGLAVLVGEDLCKRGMAFDRLKPNEERLFPSWGGGAHFVRGERFGKLSTGLSNH